MTNLGKISSQHKSH